MVICSLPLIFTILSLYPICASLLACSFPFSSLSLSVNMFMSYFYRYLLYLFVLTDTVLVTLCVCVCVCVREREFVHKCHKDLGSVWLMVTCGDSVTKFNQASTIMAASWSQFGQTNNDCYLLAPKKKKISAERPLQKLPTSLLKYKFKQGMFC